jgi:hypothetical protein
MAFITFVIVSTCVSKACASGPASKVDTGEIVLYVTSSEGLSSGPWLLADVSASLDQEESTLKEEEEEFTQKEGEKREKLEAKIADLDLKIGKLEERIAECQAKVDDVNSKQKTKDSNSKRIEDSRAKIVEYEGKKNEIDSTEMMKLSDSYQAKAEIIKKAWDELTERREKISELEKVGVAEINVKLRIRIKVLK